MKRACVERGGVGEKQMKCDEMSMKGESRNMARK